MAPTALVGIETIMPFLQDLSKDSAFWGRLGFFFLVIVGVVFAFAMVRPFFLLTLPYPIDYNEGWNAGHAARVLAGLPLYPPSSALITNNYPPLSFLFIASLGQTGEGLIFVGRLVALVSFFSCAYLIYLLSRFLGFGFRGSLVGALILLATISRFFPYYIGMNDPQWLAHAVMLVGLCVLVRLNTHLATVLAVALMLTAGLIKHNIIAVPIAAFFWLLIYARGRVPLFLISSLLLGAAAVLVLNYVYGADLWHNLINARGISFERFLSKQEHLLAVLVIFLAWIGFTLKNPKAFLGPQMGLVQLLIGWGLLEFWLCVGGNGVAGNATFDLVIAVSLAAAGLVSYFMNNPVKAKGAAAFCLFSFLVLLQFVAWPNIKYLRPAFDADERDRLLTRSKEISETVAALRDIPGEAWCDMPAICYWAGKSFTYDAFNTSERVAAGIITPHAIKEEFDRLHINALQFNESNVSIKDAKTPNDGLSLLLPYLAFIREDVTPDNSYGTLFARK
jgi:hypothetical protein